MLTRTENDGYADSRVLRKVWAHMYPNQMHPSESSDIVRGGSCSSPVGMQRGVKQSSSDIRVLVACIVLGENNHAMMKLCTHSFYQGISQVSKYHL
jgi:hypothetical protein